jgi:hypothetical protein
MRLRSFKIREGQQNKSECMKLSYDLGTEAEVLWTLHVLGQGLGRKNPERFASYAWRGLARPRRGIPGQGTGSKKGSAFTVHHASDSSILQSSGRIASMLGVARPDICVISARQRDERMESNCTQTTLYLPSIEA